MKAGRFIGAAAIVVIGIIASVSITNSDVDAPSKILPLIVTVGACLAAAIFVLLRGRRGRSARPGPER